MKVIVTIAILFSQIYSANLDIKEHGAYALKIVEQFTNSDRAADCDRIPFENLNSDRLNKLKSLFHSTIHTSTNPDRLVAVLPNETSEILPIRLEDHLNILSAIEDPAFKAVKDAASESLTAFSQTGLWAKPNNISNMQKWMSGWRRVIKSLDEIIEETTWNLFTKF